MQGYADRGVQRISRAEAGNEPCERKEPADPEGFAPGVGGSNRVCTGVKALVDQSDGLEAGAASTSSNASTSKGTHSAQSATMPISA